MRIRIHIYVHNEHTIYGILKLPTHREING